MAAVTDRDIAWIRRDTPRGMTIRSAVPGGFEVYGLLDIDERARPTEDVLLATLAPSADEQLVAGWIDRGPWDPQPGAEHRLYSGWRYRLRWTTAGELRGLPSEGEGGFPDLVFPRDRSWLVSLLWDDSWRSIGARGAIATRIEQTLPSFERIRPDVDIGATGRHPC